MTRSYSWLKRFARAVDIFQRWARFKILASRLNPWRIPSLSSSSFDGQRVLIIGPAQTVIEDLTNVRVDDFDVIVRLNNGLTLAQENPAVLGARTDVLFHNLIEHGDRSAGQVSLNLLQLHGVQILVFPHWGFKGSKSRLYRKRRELRALNGPPLMVPPSSFCEKVRRQLDGFQPTVGASAILFFLNTRAREVAVHGFTFFQTPYLAGYNDAVATPSEARAWAAASLVHDTLRERSLIAKEIGASKQRGMAVTLGVNVSRFLNGS